MRTRSMVVTVAMVAALVALVAGWAVAAGAKQYQFTGSVTEVDAKAKTISVDKGGDVWQFSTEGQKDLKVKKGDKITVHYMMMVKKIEAK